MDHSSKNKKPNEFQSSLSKYHLCVTAENENQVKVIAELKFSDDPEIESPELTDNVPPITG